MPLVYQAFDNMAFSSKQTYVLRNIGGTIQQVPYAAGIHRSYTHWILHNQGGNVYPKQGSVNELSASGK